MTLYYVKNDIPDVKFDVGNPIYDANNPKFDVFELNSNRNCYNYKTAMRRRDLSKDCVGII